jgi:hypothetical protein
MPEPRRGSPAIAVAIQPDDRRTLRCHFAPGEGTLRRLSSHAIWYAEAPCVYRSKIHLTHFASASLIQSLPRRVSSSRARAW